MTGEDTRWRKPMPCPSNSSFACACRSRVQRGSQMTDHGAHACTADSHSIRKDAEQLSGQCAATRRNLVTDLGCGNVASVPLHDSALDVALLLTCVYSREPALESGHIATLLRLSDKCVCA